MSNPTLTGLVFALDSALAKVPLHDDGVASALRALRDALPRYEAAMERAETSAADDAVRALARFGAEIAGRFWLDTDSPEAGFRSRDRDGDELTSIYLDGIAISTGVMVNQGAPGIRDVVARLTNGDA